MVLAARQEGADRWPVALLGVGVAAVLAVNGGFFPTSWGWAATALAWAVVLVAALGTVTAPSRADLAFCGAFVALAVWTAASQGWTESRTATPLELERTLVYVAGALAVVLMVRRAQVRTLLGATFTGLAVICLYALLTRLFSGGFGTQSAVGGIRLSTPVGYWNGLGLIAAMAMLLGLVIAAALARRGGSALAGAAVPILAATLYFTFGRGAWLALFVGLVVLVAADRERVQLVVSIAPLAAISAFAVWRASRYAALTHVNARSSDAVSEGHSLAIIVLLCCIAGGYAAVVLRRVPAADRQPQWLRQGVARTGVAVLVIAIVVILARFGAPWTIARHAYDSFTRARPIASTQTNLNARLFSFSNNGRLASWRVAWHAFTSHPLGGIGAGSFEEYWNRHRHTYLTIEDAHSLYLETLAGLGVVGLAILLVALAAPLAAFRRARSHPLAAGALAAFAAFLIHAAADWDWELSGVTLAALLCGGALLAAAREDVPANSRWRWTSLGLGSVVGVIALLGLIGSLALSASGRAATNGNWNGSAGEARKARTWEPWSATPWQRLGEAQLGQGNAAAARRSFLTAVSKEPNDWELWVDLARASSGSAQAAAFDRAHELNPLEPEIRQLRRQLHGKPAISGGRS